MPEKTTKILYIITKSVWAGAGKYVYDLATALPQARFRTAVAAGGTGPLTQKIISSGIPYFEIKNFQRDISIFKEFFAFFEILSLLIKTKPGIIHVSSAKAGGVAGVAFFIYRLFKKPMRAVFTVHGWTFNEPRPKWQIFLIKFFSRLTCVFYDKIICVSEYDYQSAIKNKIAPTKKMAMIHNGIKPEDYNFLPREEALGHLMSKLDIKCPVIGAIGEFTKNKGQKYLIEAIKLLVTRFSLRITTIIIGFGEEKLNLKSQISNLQLKNQIFLIENISDAANHLKAFDIFVLPSLKEGLPYVLLEAGLAEIPIIATSVGGIPEITGPSTGSGQAGILVNPANSEQLAEAIKKIIENPKLAKALAANARQKILSEFSFEKMLQQTLAAYEN